MGKFLLLFFTFLAGFILSALFFAPMAIGEREVYAPGNHLGPDRIQVFEDRVILDVPDVVWASFKDTGSMKPFFDHGAHALQYRPRVSSDISVGDIVTFENDQGIIVVHRVVHKGSDAQGIYFITQGDNNRVSDPGRLRFDDIRTVLFAIIY